MIGVFETEGREVFDLGEAIVAELGIRPGMVVTDIGAGTRAFLGLFAEAVGDEGHVFAADISVRFVEHLRNRASEAGHRNVTAVLSAYESATLPAGATDLLYVCDTYHHLDDHEAMLASIRRSLTPDGKMVVVDFDRVESVGLHAAGLVQAKLAGVRWNLLISSKLRPNFAPCPLYGAAVKQIQEQSWSRPAFQASRCHARAREGFM